MSPVTAMSPAVTSAGPAAGLLSFNAPLSRAMIGAEPGDLLPFAGQQDAIEIVAISVPR